MKTDIQTIPHAKQRYETVGDWYYDGEEGATTLRIRVSQLSDPRYEFLIAIHELIEVTLCAEANVSQETVDAFDRGYEAARAIINPNDKSEPGSHPDAPYHEQHKIATQIEQQLAAALGVDWRAYEKEVESLHK